MSWVARPDLVELVPQGQELQLLGPGHRVQRLVEEVSERQDSQALAPHRALDLLVEHPPEEELLEPAWPLHAVHGLIGGGVDNGEVEARRRRAAALSGGDEHAQASYTLCACSSKRRVLGGGVDRGVE